MFYFASSPYNMISTCTLSLSIYIHIYPDENLELPHIAAPFTAGCDRLLVFYEKGSKGETLSNECHGEESKLPCVSPVLPQLGQIVKETDPDRSLRRSGKVS